MGSYLSSQANTQPRRNNKDNNKKLLPCPILYFLRLDLVFQCQWEIKNVIPFSKAFKCVSQSPSEWVVRRGLTTQIFPCICIPNSQWFSAGSWFSLAVHELLKCLPLLYVAGGIAVIKCIQVVLCPKQICKWIKGNCLSQWLLGRGGE